MDQDIRQELRRLRLFAYAASSLLCIVALGAFARTFEKTKFEEIDVERINIVEKDGKLRLVISNRDRSPGPIFKGKPFARPGGDRPGMIFFNDEGTENGGLTFTGRADSAGKYRAVSHFSFDQFNQDQILYFQYSDNNGQRRTGMTIADRSDVPIIDLVALRDSISKMPEGAAKAAMNRRFMEPRPGEPIFAQRVYVGRDVSKTALVLLSDKMGKPRIRLAVDSSGRGSLDFLDASGKVTYSVSDSAARR